jgi:hypothetical protein
MMRAGAVGSLTAGLLLFGAVLSTSAQTHESYDYLRHHGRGMNVLLGWGAASMATGVPMVLSEDERIRGLGVQNLLWGAVNTTLAVLGKRRDRRLQRPIDHDAKRLDYRRVMMINGFIDLAYIGSGVAMMSLGKSDFIRGTGVGFTIQGSFLLGYDWVNFGLTFQ